LYVNEEKKRRLSVAVTGESKKKNNGTPEYAPTQSKKAEAPQKKLFISVVCGREH
jgi:hypothetical protein